LSGPIAKDPDAGNPVVSTTVIVDCGNTFPLDAVSIVVDTVAYGVPVVVGCVAPEIVAPIVPGVTVGADGKLSPQSPIVVTLIVVTPPASVVTICFVITVVNPDSSYEDE
jgi:hypothetical protein